jgi:tRNA 2-selenouridine synthase
MAPTVRQWLHCWRGGMRSGAVLWLLELPVSKFNLLIKATRVSNQS